MASRHLGRGHRGHGRLGSESRAARDPAGGGVGVRERGRRVHGRHRRVAHAGHDVRDGAVVRGPALVRVERALQSVAEVVGGRRRVSCRWCEDGQPARRKARLRPRGQLQGLREQELRADHGKPHELSATRPGSCSGGGMSRHDPVDMLTTAWAQMQPSGSSSPSAAAFASSSVASPSASGTAARRAARMASTALPADETRGGGLHGRLRRGGAMNRGTLCGNGTELQ